MSLSSTTRRNNYTGNGSVSSYDYTFKIFLSTELEVTVRNTDDEETTLVETTDYTVNDAGETAGGSIDLVNSAQAWLTAGGKLKSNYIITLRRKRALTQITDIRNQGAYYPEIIEDQFDKTIMIGQQQQDELDRSVKLPTTMTTADFDPTLPADIVGQSECILATNVAGTGWEAGPTVDWLNAQVAAATAAQAAAEAAQTAAQAAQTAAETAETNAELAETNAETAETNAETAEALAEDWANKITGVVASAEYSAKAYAIGGTGITDTSGKGSAKEWAIETASTVDTLDYSAKEWAKGTQTRGIASGGSSKDWANYTDSTVDNAEYSAKEWAKGTQTRGDASGGSAKDWATYTGGTVDDAEYSAKHYASIAAINAGSPTFSTITAAGAYAPIVADGSRYVLFDATLGNQSLTLPAITPADDGLTYTVKKIDASANTVTITGTVEGEVDPVIDYQYTGRAAVAINGSWYWRY